MKKIIRKIIVFSIVFMVMIIYKQKHNIDINNQNREIQIPRETIQITIVDKYNNMKYLHEKARAEQYVLVDIIIDGNYYYNVGIRTKGSVIYQYLKKHQSDLFSYKVKLDYTNSEQRYLGMNEILINSQVMDEARIREYIVYEVYNKMGIDIQRYGLAKLKIGEEEKGLVTIVEKINEEYVKDKYLYSDINLYKPEKMDDSHENGARLHYMGERIEDYYGIFNNIITEATNAEDKTRLIKILKRIEEAENIEEIEKNFIDFDKIIKSVAINKAVANVDNFTGKTTRNFYLCEVNDKIDILPFDFNISLGMCPEGFNWTQEDINTVELIEYKEEVHSQIIDIIMENEEYKERYDNYVQEAIKVLQEIDIDAIIANEQTKGIEELKQFIKSRTKNE